MAALGSLQAVTSLFGTSLAQVCSGGMHVQPVTPTEPSSSSSTALIVNVTSVPAIARRMEDLQALYADYTPGEGIQTAAILGTALFLAFAYIIYKAKCRRKGEAYEQEMVRRSRRDPTAAIMLRLGQEVRKQRKGKASDSSDKSGFLHQKIQAMARHTSRMWSYGQLPPLSARPLHGSLLLPAPNNSARRRTASVLVPPADQAQIRDRRSRSCDERFLLVTPADLLRSSRTPSLPKKAKKSPARRTAKAPPDNSPLQLKIRADVHSVA